MDSPLVCLPAKQSKSQPVAADHRKGANGEAGASKGPNSNSSPSVESPAKGEVWAASPKGATRQTSTIIAPTAFRSDSGAWAARQIYLCPTPRAHVSTFCGFRGIVVAALIVRRTTYSIIGLWGFPSLTHKVVFISLLRDEQTLGRTHAQASSLMRVN